MDEFNILFMALISTCSLPETHSNKLYEFIRLILPDDSTLADTFYKFNKSFNYEMIKEKKLCSICQKEMKLNQCPNLNCASANMSKKERVKKSIKIVIANVCSQLKNILSNYYERMITYKGKAD